MARPYALMDTDNLNMVSTYRTRAAALRVVAEAARRYGETSDEARALVLFRQNGPAEQGFIARGGDLVRLALARGLGRHRAAPVLPALADAAPRIVSLLFRKGSAAAPAGWGPPAQPLL